MMNILSNFINKVILQFKILKNISFIKKNKIKFIFYSESAAYQKYAFILIKILSEKYPNEVYYVSSDMKDRIDNLNVKNFYIGNGFLLQYFFLSIKAENFFLTLTDLDNHILKKNNNVNKYIYYFHSAASTTKLYTAGAFDNYDIIMCNGEYQIREIKQREILKKLPKKKLIKNGYAFFDYLNDKINRSKIANSVLLAPSWNYNEKNFINENFLWLIKVLLEKNFNVIFRPHPEHFKRSTTILEKIKKNIVNKNFQYDEDPENFTSIENSKCLITDNSGIAIEYTLITKRPVLYLEDNEKLHNQERFDYKNLMNLEEDVKSIFGSKFNKDDIEKIDLLISKSIDNFKNRQLEVENFVNKNFYNYTKIGFFLKDNFDTIVK